VGPDDRQGRADGGWRPADGARFGDGELIATIGDLLRFAGVLR
jgi:hypothetical protein